MSAVKRLFPLPLIIFSPLASFRRLPALGMPKGGPAVTDIRRRKYSITTGRTRIEDRLQIGYDPAPDQISSMLFRLYSCLFPALDEGAGT